MQVEDAEESLSMLRRFPLLLPNDDLKGYRGFFKAGCSEYFLDVTLPNAPAVSEMKFNHYSPNLKTILTDYRKDIVQWTSSSKSFYKFVEWLQNRVNLEQAGSESEIYIMAWENIYRDIKQHIGLENLSDADEKSLEWIELKVVDLVDREHKLKVHIQVSASQYEANLPSNALKLIQTATSVVDAYKLFEEQVMKLQKFWDVLEEIDSNCNIIEPAKPTLADVHRQISIESGVTLILNIDPYDPLAKPDIKVLGSDTKTQHIQAILRDSEWPISGESLLEKLQEFLGVSLSRGKMEQDGSQPMSQQDSQNELCCICLLGDDLDQGCEGCNSNFHLACLTQWLQTVPNHRIAFNTISGKCPQCQGPIACPCSA